jgi:glycosyltransferase involved in cell wall biosynthesis
MADNPRVRVCFISLKAYQLFNPQVKEVFGGAEVDLYLLAMELAKDKDFVVTFLTADYGQKQTETIDGVRIIKSLDFKKNALCGAVRVWRAMRQADADIYALKTVSPGVPLAALFCRLHRKIFAYRTASTQECDGTYAGRHFFLGRAFNWSLRQAGIIFAQNTADKESLQRTAGVSAVVIPNGHILPTLQQCEREMILWVGRSDKIKRPELFIDLAGKMPNGKFVMICQRATGDEKYEELLTHAGCVRNLQFIKYVPFCEIDSYFQRAKVFVNTSESEGFPNTFIQACNHAVPILSLNVNPDGFLDKYNCGQSCDGQFQKLIDSLKFMLAENRFAELGENARRYAEQNHDIKRIVEQYKKLFLQLAGENDTRCVDNLNNLLRE